MSNTNYSAESLSEYISLSASELSEELTGARWSWSFVRNDIRLMRRAGASVRDIEAREWDLRTISVSIRKIMAVQAMQKPVEVVYFRQAFEQNEDGEWVPMFEMQEAA